MRSALRCRRHFDAEGASLTPRTETFLYHLCSAAGSALALAPLGVELGRIEGLIGAHQPVPHLSDGYFFKRRLEAFSSYLVSSKVAVSSLQLVMKVVVQRATVDALNESQRVVRQMVSDEINTCTVQQQIMHFTHCVHHCRASRGKPSMSYGASAKRDENI